METTSTALYVQVRGCHSPELRAHLKSITYEEVVQHVTWMCAFLTWGVISWLQFRHWEGEKAIGGAQFECFMKRGNNFGPREMREQKILQG
jgi:hypothetical protein